MLENFVNALIKLLKVKSLVTLILTGVFATLALYEVIDAQQFMTIFTTIIGFYFGTQYEKKDKPSEDKE